MSSMTDLLLSNGENLAEIPEDEFEIKRLSDKLGQPFIVKAHALTTRQFDALPKGDSFKYHVILEAVTDPDFHDPKLGDRLKPDNRKTPLTPVEVIDALLLPGEVINLHNAISALSGFDDSAVERIKKN